jgi:hypothetical protein
VSAGTITTQRADDLPERGVRTDSARTIRRMPSGRGARGCVDPDGSVTVELAGPFGYSALSRQPCPETRYDLPRTAIASISTRAPAGSAATCTVARAGCGARKDPA